MYRFFVLRGAPATGKSTWCANNGVEGLVVSSDAIRLEHFGTEYDENGHERIVQGNPGFVWGEVARQIEERMQTGEDIILDACSINRRDMEPYRNIVNDYGYDAYVVALWEDVSLEDCLERNRSREAYNQVPEDVIERFYRNLSTQSIPDFYEVLSGDAAAEMLREEFAVD